MPVAAEKLPGFLIIGAMKSGTTTLYRDLYEHPRIFLPELKEPNSLCSDDVLEPTGRANYARLFSRANPEQLCGEASTTYTKWPDYTGIALRAKHLLGNDLKLIYVVRDPIERIKSQYSHEFERGLIKQSIDDAVRDVPRLINYSRYGKQIEQWLEHFPRQNLLIVRLDDYAADRERGVASLGRFLRVAPEKLDKVHAERFNSSETRFAVNRTVRALLYRLPFYHKYIQPLIPWQIRRGVSKYLFRRVQKVSTEMRQDTVEFIRTALRHDMAALDAYYQEQTLRLASTADAVSA